jgi:hypothetical protein
VVTPPELAGPDWELPVAKRSPAANNMISATKSNMLFFFIRPSKKRIIEPITKVLNYIIHLVT